MLLDEALSHTWQQGGRLPGDMLHTCNFGGGAVSHDPKGMKQGEYQSQFAVWAVLRPSASTHTSADMIVLCGGGGDLQLEAPMPTLSGYSFSSFAALHSVVRMDDRTHEGCVKAGLAAPLSVTDLVQDLFDSDGDGVLESNVPTESQSLESPALKDCRLPPPESLFRSGRVIG